MADEPRISYIIGRLDHSVSREIAKRVAPLTVAQYTALSLIRARSGLSNAQLARRVYVTAQSMNAVVAHLEREGLIKRAPDPGHGRILRSELTRSGRALLKRSDAALDEMEHVMLGDMPARQRSEFRRMLDESVQRLEAELLRH